MIDPNRTRTAETADRHIAPRPGTDGALLFAVVNTLFDGTWWIRNSAAWRTTSPAWRRSGRRRWSSPRGGGGALRGDRAPDPRAGGDIAAGPRTAVYGRIGTSTVTFGTLTSWLVDVINLLTGNLDRPGGAMFPTSPIGSAPPTEAGAGLLRRAVEQPGVRPSRGVLGLPTALLPEEIETAGEGQIKAVVTIAGNPVLSAPDGDRLSAALDRLDFMVSIDPYLNETTRHADVILPPPPPSYTPHFDILLSGVAVRSNARYSPPVFPLPQDAWTRRRSSAGSSSVSSVWESTPTGTR